VRGRVHSLGALSILRSSSSEFRELIQQRGIPLTPGPSPTLGRGEPTFATCLRPACENVTIICIPHHFRLAVRPLGFQHSLLPQQPASADFKVRIPAPIVSEARPSSFETSLNSSLCSPENPLPWRGGAKRQRSRSAGVGLFLTPNNPPHSSSLLKEESKGVGAPKPP